LRLLEYATFSTVATALPHFERFSAIFEIFPIDGTEFSAARLKDWGVSKLVLYSEKSTADFIRIYGRVILKSMPCVGCLNWIYREEILKATLEAKKKATW
jgi:hypothetical protein